MSKNLKGVVPITSIDFFSNKRIVDYFHLKMPMVSRKNKSWPSLSLFIQIREPTKAFAYICIAIICTIYESGVLALWGGGTIL